LSAVYRLGFSIIFGSFADLILNARTSVNEAAAQPSMAAMVRTAEITS
jgi:hypothetical protein